MGNYAKPSRNPIIIQSKTGLQIQGGLFDYSLHQVKLKIDKIIVDDEGCLNNHNGTLAISTDSEPLVNSLVEIEFIDTNQISIQSLTSKISDQKLWIYAANNPVGIQIGDQIKLGRFQFKIHKIQLSQEGRNQAKSYFFRPSFIQQNIGLMDSKIQQCRICFMSGDEANQLISPCLCSGSQKFIHLKCLRDWLATKIECKQDNMSQTIISQPLKCQICSTLFKQQLQLNNGTQPLLKRKQFPPPYIILEGNKRGDQRKISIISKIVEGRQTTLGRDTNCDIVISEISISRNHCSFQLENNKVYLRDKQSKFGTLVRPASSMTIKNQIQLQYENTVLKFKQTESFLLGCCKANQFKIKFLS